MSFESEPELVKFLLKIQPFRILKPGEKFNTGNLDCIDGNGFYSFYYRLTRWEGRKNLLIFLKQIIVEMHDYMERYDNSAVYPDKIFLKTLVLHVNYMRSGITNLMLTYQSDQSVLDELHDRLTDIDTELPKYYYLLYEDIGNFGNKEDRTITEELMAYHKEKEYKMKSQIPDFTNTFANFCNKLLQENNINSCESII